MRHEFEDHEHWSHRFLPHYDVAGKYQMITYRLGDALPEDLMLGAPHSDAGIDDPTKLARRKLSEELLDQGYGSCILSQPDVAEKVIEAWKCFDGQKYDLISYVVMPNHIHCLIKTYEAWPLGKIVWSWKRHVPTLALPVRRCWPPGRCTNRPCAWQSLCRPGAP